MQFGMLTALFPMEDRKHWAFLCSCGTTHIANPSHVRRIKGTMSCGCHKSVNAGLSDGPEYALWHSTYSKKWLDFKNFWVELGPRPEPCMHVVPIDVEKPVGPKNAMWGSGKALFGQTEINSFKNLDEMITNNQSIAAIHQAAYETRQDPSTFEWHLGQIEKEHQPKEDLEAQQDSLENSSMEYSKNQWLRSQSTLDQKGRMSQATVGKEFLHKLVPVLALRIDENCKISEKRLRQGGGKHGSAHHKLIPMLRSFVDDHTLAYITIACVMDSIGRGASVKTPAVKVMSTIGERLDHQLFMAIFAESDPVEFQRAEKRFLKDETRTYKRKVYAMQRIVQERQSYEPLSDEERLILGSWCLKCLESVTKWFETTNLRPDPKKVNTVAFLTLSLEGLKHRSLIEAAASAAQFQAWPMVTKPLDWGPEKRGGYLKGHPGGSAVLIHGNRGTELSDESFDGINRLQSTPWRINRLIYEVQKELLSTTHQIGAFKSYEKDSWMDQYFPYVDPKVWNDADSEEAAKAKQLLNKAYDDKVLAEKQRQIPQRVLEVAARFVNFEKIYMPCFVDARGRMYYTCETISPQGSDYQKSLLEFAEGTPVTEDNFAQIEREYLINLANTWDKKQPGSDRKTSKLSFDDRCEVMRDFCKDFGFVVDDPNESEAKKIWTSAEEPFLFLATLVEYFEVCVYKSKTTCHAPLALDATNSGSQILGAVLRDEKLCHFCNVTPSEDALPQDMYAEVARFAQAKWNSHWRDGEYERINNNARKKSEKINKGLKAAGKPEDHVPKIDFECRTKPEEITRSITKKATMCSSYGASHNSKRKYIQAEFEDAGYKDAQRLGYVELLALTNAVVKGQDEAFPILKQINHFFMTVGTLCLANKQDFVHWRTPTGNIIRQEYREPVTKQVRTYAMGGGDFQQFRNSDTVQKDSKSASDTRYDLMVGYGDVIESKTASALAANWTHSIDASIAVTAINAFDSPCGFIHDCLVAPPGRAFEFQAHIRHAFHKCVSANVFDMLAEQNDLTYDLIRENISEDRRFQLGNVNIDDCLNSEYLFS